MIFDFTVYNMYSVYGSFFIIGQHRAVQQNESWNFFIKYKTIK